MLMGGRGECVAQYSLVEAALVNGFIGVVVGAEPELEGPTVVLGHVHLDCDFLQQVNGGKGEQIDRC